MHLPIALAAVLAATALTAQSVQPPFNAHYTAVDLGVMPGAGNYGGIAFKHDDPNVLLVAGYGTGRIVRVPLVRDGQGRIAGFGTYSVHATVGGTDGGLAYGPGNVLFHTWYGANQLGQIEVGSTTDDRVIQLAPLGVTGSVGSCAFTPSDHPTPQRLKLVTYHSSLWYDVTLTADGNGTYSITNLGPAIQLQGGPEGILYPPANAPLLGNHGKVLVAEWNGPGLVAYSTDANGDPIVGTRQVVMTGLSAMGGGAVDPVSGDMLVTGAGGRLVALRAFASCGTAIAYGTGTAGANGVPQLSIHGCPRLGQNVTLEVTSGAPGAFGVLMVGVWTGNLQVLGIHLLTSHDILATHSLDATGRLVTPLTIPTEPRLGDQHLFFQSVYLDAAAPQLLSATRGLDLHIL